MKVNNPVLSADMPDPDVLRVGDVYYMVSTTMYFMPGGEILKSRDLVHWEPVSHIFETIEDNDTYQLKNGKHAYGKGQWATSLTYYNGQFYACFVCWDQNRTYIYHTDDIEKSFWERFVIEEVFHDMSFLFWEGKPYLVYGNGEIFAAELAEDLSGLKPGGLRAPLFSTPKEGMNLRCEGCRAYVRNGYIYLCFIDIPSMSVGSGQRREICYRSRALLGPYENRVVMDDDMGRERRGVAQGPLIETADGTWYAMLFQDRGAVGRIPCLMPMRWENDWPVIGIEGKVPLSFEISGAAGRSGAMSVSDDFARGENTLPIQWQWNHNPMNDCWSLQENPGHLRLTTGQLATGLMDARNTLTQRTEEPFSSYSAELSVTGLKPGDYAGLAAFQSTYGQLGIRFGAEGKELVQILRVSRTEFSETARPFEGDRVFLRIDFNYEDATDKADFYVSADGQNWERFGETLQMKYTLDVFTGYRIALFNYATQEAGGFADFADFRRLSGNDEK